MTVSMRSACPLPPGLGMPTTQPLGRLSVLTPPHPVKITCNIRDVSALRKVRPTHLPGVPVESEPRSVIGAAADPIAARPPAPLPPNVKPAEFRKITVTPGSMVSVTFGPPSVPLTSSRPFTPCGAVARLHVWSVVIGELCRVPWTDTVREPVTDPDVTSTRDVPRASPTANPPLTESTAGLLECQVTEEGGSGLPPPSNAVSCALSLIMNGDGNAAGGRITTVGFAPMGDSPQASVATTMETASH